MFKSPHASKICLVALALAGTLLSGCAQRDYNGLANPHPPVRELVVVEKTLAEYPYDEARAGVQGCVVASFIVRGDGRADKFLIHDSKPFGQFDRAALKSWKQWRFEPPARPNTRYASIIKFELPPAQPGTDFVVQPMPECRALPTFAQLNPNPRNRPDRQAFAPVQYDEHGWPLE